MRQEHDTVIRGMTLFAVRGRHYETGSKLDAGEPDSKSHLLHIYAATSAHKFCKNIIVILKMVCRIKDEI